jgi:cytochrome c-type biogenesis protein CcmH
MRKLQVALAIPLSFLLFWQVFAPPGYAQGSGPTDDEVNEIAQQLYCPVCPSEPLETCQTQACVQWRDTIREKLALGWDEDQIKAFFVEQYGPRVLDTPPAQGFTLLIYLLPPLVLLIGGFILFRALQAWRVKTPAPEVERTESDDPYIAQLEQELRQLDE